MDRIDKDEELVCPLCGGRLFWMPVSHIYACEHCKQSYSERNGVYMKKKRKSTAEKSSAVGDAAKLREAAMIVYDVLEKLRPFSLCLRDVGRTREFNHLVCLAKNRLDAALAAPPRNCDRFATVDEARKAHEAICEKYDECHHCPLNNEEHYSAFDYFEAWLFAPATEKEGGAE